MTEPVQPPQVTPRRSGSPGAAVLGGILIVLGLVFFASQQLDINIGEWTWPFYVIAPGLGLLTLGLTQRKGEGLAVAGSIVTIVGVVLLYQNATDHWESWAYAWALVGPGGNGLGRLLYGTRSGNVPMAREGFWSIMSGLAIFAVGFVFFEGVLGISGRRWPLPEWAMPVAIIVIGVLVLLRGLTSSRHHLGEWSGSPDDSGPTEGGDKL